jgi:predicted alpha/beta-hydrolase family hydrolase
MNALLLPGNSSHHGKWVEKLKSALSSHFDITQAQHYRHWRSGEEWADVEYEIDTAKDKVANLEPYVIIGKSVGTVVAAKGTSDNILHPAKLILLGIPINGGASSEPFKQWLHNISIPVVIVQNTADPLGSFSEVKTIFEDSGKYISFAELPGSTHDYVDFQAIAKLI